MTVTVAAIEGGTRVTVEGDLKARVPFIGGKVEEAAAPSVLSGIRKERQVGLAWLQDESA